MIAARRVRIAAGAGMLVCACGAAVAHAQTPVTTRPSPVSGRDVQMSGGVSILTPVGLGSRDITLLTGDGQPFTIARTTNRTGASLGAEARLGFRLNDAVRAELSGGWSRVPFETNVTDDIEGAEALTASINISRFTVGGTAVVRITEYGSRQIFAIAGASWMREATTLGAGSVFEDGAIAEGGIGVKMWWRERPRGRIRRVGLRLEGRVGLKTGGLELGTRSVHIVPVFAGSLMIGS